MSAAVVGLSWFLNAGALAGAPGQLLVPGEAPDDPSATEGWLGLVESDGVLAWQPVGLGAGAGAEAPLLMVRGVAGLKPGPVVKRAVDPQALPPGSDVDLGEGRRLIAEGEPTGPYTLSLVAQDGPTQLLVSHAVLEAAVSPTLLLVGDLDGDGQVDLLIDTANHLDLSRYTLFLSSAAGKGQLLAPVATLLSTGC